MIFRNMLTIAASLALALAVAVPSQAALSPEDKTSIKDVKRETRELIKAIESYSAEQRDQAIQEIEIAVARLDQRIESLQSRIDNQWDDMISSQALLELPFRFPYHSASLTCCRSSASSWRSGMET